MRLDPTDPAARASTRSTSAEPSPFDGVPRWKLGAVGLGFIVFVLVVVGAALVSSKTGDPEAIVKSEPVPWTVIGTRDDGRSVVVQPFDNGGICNRWGARVLAQPAAGPVQIQSERGTTRCTGPQPAVGLSAPSVEVMLDAPLAGRAVKGPRMRPLAAMTPGPPGGSAATAGSSSNSPRRVAIPGVIGLPVADARRLLLRLRLQPKLARGAAKTPSYVVAQSPPATSITAGDPANVGVRPGQRIELTTSTR